MKAVASVIGGLIAVLALTWVIQGNEFFLYKYWAPKQEQVRREVFENTRSFNQGMVQELENMQVEYITSKDPEAKKALAGVILHRASGYNLKDPIVTDDLRNFIDKLKKERQEAR